MIWKAGDSCLILLDFIFFPLTYLTHPAILSRCIWLQPKMWPFSSSESLFLESKMLLQSRKLDWLFMGFLLICINCRCLLVRLQINSSALPSTFSMTHLTAFVNVTKAETCVRRCKPYITYVARTSILLFPYVILWMNHVRTQHGECNNRWKCTWLTDLQLLFWNWAGTSHNEQDLCIAYYY